MDSDGSVPLWWILVFLLLALGGSMAAINAMGGSIL
ncbi:MAG: hypothetical protein A07HN63_01294 [uncultured archaeon A07HN63]|jgi:hypothetical protein|nr:MAG: hypothetical protein A07HN63_01294 [uncultured archaeon A07HN63]